MGRRAAAARFMPGHYVFPGGVREPDDRSLAWTALRETREETGLTIAGTGRLLPIAHAVTPEILPIRFDTVFYLSTLDVSDGTPCSCGELEAVGWQDVELATGTLPTADITRAVLAVAMEILHRGFDPAVAPKRIRLFRYDGIRMHSNWETWTPR